VNVVISFIVDINRVGTWRKRDGVCQHKASCIRFEPRVELDESRVDFPSDHQFGYEQVGLDQPHHEWAEYVVQKQQEFSRRNPLRTPEFHPSQI